MRAKTKQTVGLNIFSLLNIIYKLKIKIYHLFWDILVFDWKI